MVWNHDVCELYVGMYSVLRLGLLAHQTNTEQATLPSESYESGKAYIGGWRFTEVDVGACIDFQSPDRLERQDARASLLVHTGAFSSLTSELGCLQSTSASAIVLQFVYSHVCKRSSLSTGIHTSFTSDRHRASPILQLALTGPKLLHYSVSDLFGLAGILKIS